MKRRLACLWFSLAAMALAADRDPTMPPVEASAAVSPQAAVGGYTPAQGASVIMQNGRAFLVVGTRLYAVGQVVGNAKLERITETEIWLREGRRLIKQPRFAGIQRVAATPAVACAAQPAASASRVKRKAAALGSSASAQAVTPVASCEGAQP